MSLIFKSSMKDNMISQSWSVKELNILLVFYTLTIAHGKENNSDLSNSISSAAPLFKISLDALNKQTQTGMTSLSLIKFN